MYLSCKILLCTKVVANKKDTLNINQLKNIVDEVKKYLSNVDYTLSEGNLFGPSKYI